MFYVYVVSVLGACPVVLVIAELQCNWLVCTSCMASSSGVAEVAIHMPLCS